MALVTRNANADVSMDTSNAQFVPQIPDLICGEAIDPAAPCYIKGADGLVYMYDGTAVDEKAVLAGFSPRAAAIGQPITLFKSGARFGYGTALTPGIKLFGAATKGRLDTAATTGGLVPLAQVVNATDIIVVANI